MTLRATYRLQFHRDFGFADAEALVPYLHDLGISHIYASPITVARSGSMHGYDVVDPTRINPELGGEPAFRSLVAALRERGMGIVIDIVPNHMGVAGGENAWWNDVLERGPGSPFARFFDIDWHEPLVLPILGEPLSGVIAAGDLVVETIDGRRQLVVYGEHRLPIRADEPDASDDPRIVADRQHYRLASWRTANDDLNWRRFFTINDLAGLRVEDPAVFDATHALYFRLYAQGLIDGVRVDHVDGLTDPAAYCRQLRARFDAIPAPNPAYIIVEKILGSGEAMPRDWGVDGTSGYDFMEQVTALIHDPAGADPFADRWAKVSGRPAGFEPEELRARQEMLSWQFDGQLRRCVDAFVALSGTTPAGEGVTRAMLHRSIERLLWVFPVYRTYGTGDAAPAQDAAVRDVARDRVAAHLAPGEGPVADMILAWLAGEGPGDPVAAAEAVRRFQQLSAPIAAKAVEDTAFYRYGRLLSRNDVGFDAALFASDIVDFHDAMRDRAQHWPRAMLATATHDHKRGEDVRARLANLSAVGWDGLPHVSADIDPGDADMLLQTLYGAWPEGLRIDDSEGLSAYADRVIGWQEKALREAKLRSSWEAPDAAYEARCATLVRTLLDPARSPDFLAAIDALLRRTAMGALASSLAQTALKYLVPGIPDLYQGTELADFSLVDPDNRRPVDYPARVGLLASGTDPKLTLIAELLALRREDPDLFASGDYEAIDIVGARAENVMAFRRSWQDRSLTGVVALRCGAALLDRDIPVPPPAWWGDTMLESGERIADLLHTCPVWWALGRNILEGTEE